MKKILVFVLIFGLIGAFIFPLFFSDDTTDETKFQFQFNENLLVTLGQSVTIKTDKMLGDLEGTVEEIGWKVGRQDVLGTDPVVDTDARVVEVKVSLDHRSSAKVNRLTNLKVNVIIHPN